MSILTRVIFSNALRNPKNPFLSSSFSPKGHQERPKTRINSYVITKYVGVVKVFEDKMKKYFPKGAKFYEVFSVGLKYFKSDCLTLYTAFKKVTTGGWSSLTRKELEVYYQLPKDMIRAAPVVVLGAGIPMGVFVFIIAYNFPRQMLTYHFWSTEQKNEFASLSHKRRVLNYRPLVRSMEIQLTQLKNNPLKEEMSEVMDIVKNGYQPKINLILACKKLFEEAPYELEHLPNHHIVKLLKLYDMHRGWRRRRRLRHRALLIKLMDTAIVNEGGLRQLSREEIQWNCFIRGLNPIGMKEEEVMQWMTTWLKISEQVNEKSYSLLLHCPILLGCNEPFKCW